MKNKKEDFKQDDIRSIIVKSKKIIDLLYFVLVCGLILGITFLIKEWGVLTIIGTILKVLAPLFIGFIVAWLLYPLTKKLNEFGIKKDLAALLVYFAFVALIISFFSFLIPTLYDQLNDLILAFPSIFDSLKKIIENSFNNLSSLKIVDVKELQANVFNGIENWIISFTTSLPNLLLRFFAGLFSRLGTVIIGLMVGLYMLIDFDSINQHLIKVIPRKAKKETNQLINNITVELRKYVNGMMVVTFIIFVTSSIIFAIIGLKAPILFGVLCGITNLIPYIGPYIGGSAAAIVGFSQSSLIGILIIASTVVIQAIESMIIQPLIMGKTMKLHPAAIILGLLVFGHFFGIIGMVLATPSLALIKTIYQFYAKKYDWFGTDY